MSRNYPIALPSQPQEANPRHDYEASPPIGIDLGTSNCAMARWMHTTNRIGAEVYNFNTVGNPNKSKLMSSVVYLEEEDGELLVGQLAFSRRLLKPELTATAFKTRMGEIGKVFQMGELNFSAVELSAALISGQLDDVLRQGLVCPAGVVVGVPYYFKQHQNTATRNAALAAIEKSFKTRAQSPRLLALIPEPIAAALDYAFRNLDISLNETLLVFDMGGGTLDLTLVSLHMSNTHIELEVLSCEGDAQFGGVYFDEILTDHIRMEEEISENGLDEKQCRRLSHSLSEAAIQAKEELSRDQVSEVLLSNLPEHQPREVRITRKQFEAMLMGRNKKDFDYAAHLEALLKNNLNKAQIAADGVNRVLLIGGSTQIPLFRQIIARVLPASQLMNDPESTYDAVARGAAIYAAYLIDRESEECHHLPSDRTIHFISRSSHGLGIETNRGRCKIIIPENTVVPCQRELAFLPVSWLDQSRTRVLVNRINVVQGESELRKENTLIGTIEIPTIYAHGRDLNQIEVLITLELDTTTLDVDIHIPKSDPTGNAIHLKQQIHLEEGQTP